MPLQCARLQALEAAKLRPDKGLPARLACFTVGGDADGKPVPLHGFEPIFRDGLAVGMLRTGGFGPSPPKAPSTETENAPLPCLPWCPRGACGVRTCTTAFAPAWLN